MTGSPSVCNISYAPVILTHRPTVCILKANELKLYLYKAETDPTPERVVFLDDLTVVGESKDARVAHYGFSVRSRDRTYQFCTESPKERDSAYSTDLSVGN